MNYCDEIAAAAETEHAVRLAEGGRRSDHESVQGPARHQSRRRGDGRRVVRGGVKNSRQLSAACQPGCISNEGNL